MKKEQLSSLLGNTFSGFEEADCPAGYSFYRGKVRDLFNGSDQLLLSVSDRISAFDKVLAEIPTKGEVLNRLALYWFEQTQDIIENHILRQVSPRAVLVKRCEVLPVEVVVRGYLTGSAWRDYQAGKDISGINLPAGMKNNQKFDMPLITPSTKAEIGTHDEPISCNEIVQQGLVDAELWKQVEEKALALFKRGAELAAKQGLILVDTKYEFGLLDGRLVIVDEIHTPDSSRFWYADTYNELFEAGKPQRKIDKEYLRQWLIDRGFMGDGEIPVIPDEIKVEVAWRYIQAFETITGQEFTPSVLSSSEEKKQILSAL